MNFPHSRLIMLVDDSSVSNVLMQSILEQEGYHTLIASNGKEALQILKKKQPNLIILDIMMPVLDGYGVLEFIKAKKAPTKNIPVLMLTARNNSYDKTKAMEMGAIDYITKPIDIPDILNKVNTILKN